MRIPDPDFRDEAERSDAHGPGRLEIVDLGAGFGERSALDSFGVEPAEPQRPVAATTTTRDGDQFRNRIDFAPTRVAGAPPRQQAGRREPHSGPGWPAHAAGLMSLVVVAVIVLATLNWALGFITRQSDAPALSRVERQRPVSSSAAAAQGSGPAIASVPGAEAKAADQPVLEPARLSEPPPIVVEKPREIPAHVTPRRPAPQLPTVREPVRSAIAGSVGSTAPPVAPAPTPTTGVAPTLDARVDPPAPAVIPAVSAAAAAVAANSAPLEPVRAAPEPPRAAPAAAPTAARLPAAREAVESVLGRYVSAFSSLNAQSAKAVWPSVNQRNLQRAFDGLEEQVFDLGQCDIMLLPPRALAQCTGTARYTPKVGDRRERTESRRWTFRLVQSGQDWSIDSVESR